MTDDKPFKFEIETAGIKGFRVVRKGDTPVQRLVIFKAATRAKASAFLQVYLTLSIEDRRKLRAACA